MPTKPQCYLKPLDIIIILRKYVTNGIWELMQVSQMEYEN